jgi:hypothetical protein
MRPVRGCVWTRGDRGLIRWVSPEVAEVGMARRRIGQEDLIARPEPRAGATLTELAAR